VSALPSRSSCAFQDGAAVRASEGARLISGHENPACGCQAHPTAEAPDLRMERRYAARSRAIRKLDEARSSWRITPVCPVPSFGSVLWRSSTVHVRRWTA